MFCNMCLFDKSIAYSTLHLFEPIDFLPFNFILFCFNPGFQLSAVFVLRAA